MVGYIYAYMSTLQVNLFLLSQNSAEVNVAEVKVPFKIEPVVSSDLASKSTLYDDGSKKNSADSSLPNPPAAITTSFTSDPPPNSDVLNVSGKNIPDRSLPSHAVSVAKNASSERPIANDSLEIGEILGEIFGQSAAPDAPELHMPVMLCTPEVFAGSSTSVSVKPNMPVVETWLERVPGLIPPHYGP